MARLKAMVKSALDDRSPRFLLGTIALAVAVALLAGFAIGYKVDDSNGGGGGGGKKSASKPNKPGKSNAPALKGAPLLIGSVKSLNSKRVVVLNAKAKARGMGLGRKTRIYATADGTSADIKVGTRVLYVTSATTSTATTTTGAGTVTTATGGTTPRAATVTATEIIVLPAKALLGDEVTKVVPGTSMTVTTVSGPQTINTRGAVVHSTTTGKRSSLVKGRKVIVRYFVIRGRRNSATGIVVLPTDTKFK
jgi:hypothetical protein